MAENSMTSVDIHNFSMMLGELRAQMEETKVQRHWSRETLQRLDERLDVVEDLAKKISEMKPAVDRFVKLEQRGIGFFTAMTLFGGMVGSALLDQLKNAAKAISLFFS